MRVSSQETVNESVRPFITSEFTLVSQFYSRLLANFGQEVELP